MSRVARASFVAFVALFSLCSPLSAHACSVNLLCFFRPNNTEVTDRCNQILNEIATVWRNARDGGPGFCVMYEAQIPPHLLTIGVIGHAWEDGGIEANQRLSERRADAVADRLRALGVPETSLSVKGRGNRSPMLPDAPLFDPQNLFVQMYLK